MSDRDLTLKVVWSMLDKITGPLKGIKTEGGLTAKALKETRDRLKELDAQQKLVGEFRELKNGLRGTSTELKAAQDNVRSAANAMRLAVGNTAELRQKFDQAKAKAAELGDAFAKDSIRLQELRDRLSSAGISVGNLAQHERTLHASIGEANAKLGEQKQKLADVAKQQERIATARQQMDKTRTTAANLAVAGAGATASGVALMAPVKMALGESKHYSTEMQRVNALGMGEKDSKEAVNFAKQMKTYGTSRNENLELVRDAMTVFGDVHHAEMVAPLLAKMKFGNRAMYGDEKAEENDRMFMDMMKVIETRGGLNSKQDFENQANMVQQVLTATGGRVKPNEWLNLIKTGGLAAKSTKDDAFYYYLEPLVQEMGGNRVGTAMMSAYQGLYQGRTTKRAALKLEEFGLIGDPNKVMHDKAGQLSFLNPGALKGSDLFKENQFKWMEDVLLPQLASKGITEKDQVLDAIGSIFSNRTASNLFSQMYLQRGQIHKNANLNKGAANIDTLDKLAKNTANGKELEATAKLRDLQLEMGNQILPLYASALETVAHATRSVTEFMREHETVTKVIVVSLGALAAALLIFGPIMLAIASVLGPMALIKFSMATLGMQGGVLGTVLTALGGTFRSVGTAIMWLGRALLMNPIALLITGIALAAYLIYQYWDPLKTYFASLWSNVLNAFSGGIGGIAAMILNWSPLGMFYQAFAGVLSWFGITLPAKFTEFGANILQGLAGGIIGALGTVKDAVVNAGDSVVTWFKEKLGIHSPSRVFADLGDFTMQGLAVGLDRSQNEPLAQVTSLAQRLTQLGAGIAIGTAAMPALSFDTRPPVAPGTAAPVIYDSHDTVQIIIQPTPGMDPQAIARAVSAELDRRERDKAARRRSSYTDY